MPSTQGLELVWIDVASLQLDDLPGSDRLSFSEYQTRCIQLGRQAPIRQSKMTAIGRSLPVIATACAGQVECKRVVSWNAIDWSGRTQMGVQVTAFSHAGWLSSVGHRHPKVRLAVPLGRLPAVALNPDPEGPELHKTYVEVLEKLRRSIKP